MAERRPRAARPPRLPAGVFEVRPGYFQAVLQAGGQRVRESGQDPRALGEWHAEQKRKARRGRFEPAQAQRDRERLRDYLPRWLEGRRGTVGRWAPGTGATTAATPPWWPSTSGSCRCGR